MEFSDIIDRKNQALSQTKANGKYDSKRIVNTELSTLTWKQASLVNAVTTHGINKLLRLPAT
jgi:hypothetical protein